MTAALDVYARALDDPRPGLFVRAHGGGRSPAALTRWLAPISDVDERVLACATGPVLDVGCGPGRHVRALALRGVPALGVDVSPAAVRLARLRGAAVIERSIFARIPAAGSWRSALLLDGNVGIGAHPPRLLRRLACVLGPGGEVLVELDPPGSGLSRVRLRLEHGSERSAWFEWALVGSEAIDSVAADGGFSVAEAWSDGGRWFARLRRP